jgi:hypothetical protein
MAGRDSRSRDGLAWGDRVAEMERTVKAPTRLARIVEHLIPEYGELAVDVFLAPAGGAADELLPAFDPAHTAEDTSA